MADQDLFYLLALQEVDGIGDIIAKKLITHFGSAEAVFKSKRVDSVEGVGSIISSKFNDKSVFAKAEKELEFIMRNSINAYSFSDSKYPEKLKHCVDGPLLLFSTGNINLNKQKILSIVGTRQITPFGADFTRELIADLAPLNPVIVSGYAYGVDIVAHLSAIENNLQTVAVVAHGLNQIYPKNHHKYVPKVESNGGFFTEFRSTSEPEKENFVKRNRIVAGMSEATIVIESAAKGGSLITANMANGYNRDVFAVPGRTTDKFSEGCNNLIKTQKAHLLTSAADLVYMLNWDLETPSKPVQKQLFIDLEPEEQKVYDYLASKGKELLDIVALDCEMPVFRLSGMLLNMELKGVVRPLPGKLFEAI
ncbi:MAG: DNA-protecting protein DprA [Flavobacterium sp.]|nr:MAG: DNA-protecting protein DprA [Flavobacterium sp.]